MQLRKDKALLLNKKSKWHAAQTLKGIQKAVSTVLQPQKVLSKISYLYCIASFTKITYNESKHSEGNYISSDFCQ